MLLLAHGSHAALPGITLMAILAVAAWNYPVHSGLLSAVVLVLSAAATTATGARLHSSGLQTILPTENAAGLLLVLYLFWKRRALHAVTVTVALVGACVAALFTRSGSPAVLVPIPASHALALGFLQLLLAAGTGTYLRGSLSRRSDRPMRVLLRRQWPVIAVLSVFLFLETALAHGNPTSVVAVVLLCLVMAGLAVVAPRRPADAALLGALALGCAAVMMRLIGVSHYSGVLGPIPLTCVSAGMLLSAYVTRYAPWRKAFCRNAALAAAAISAIFVMPSDTVAVTPAQIMSPLLLGGLLLVVSVGTGRYFRARDAERTAAVRTEVTTAQQAERMALARELHDVVAHHVTGIVVQAQAAQVVAGQQPHVAREALDRIAASGTEALTAMRRIVGSMRSAEQPGVTDSIETATTDFESDVAALVARANKALPAEGNPWTVQLVIDLHGCRVPPEVARSGLRVVQESLTNAGKHARHVTHVRVAVTTSKHALQLRVTDNGSSTPAAPPGGYGLVGMRERVELLGGTFHAGPGEHGGWWVEASVPLDEPSQEGNGR